jgi:2-polyprenyl-3-methyl-5-hydroxy-6-metoxy-1,4-benzoquinol methylase
VNVDYEVREAFNFDVVFILETLDHLMHLDPVLLQIVLLDLLQPDFGGLLGLDLLKLFLFFHEELNQFL